MKRLGMITTSTIST